jgi:membrane protease YdiL (CAAX protease family)
MPLMPLPFWSSLFYFGLPALLFAVGFYWLMPWLIDLGMLPYYAYSVALGIPLALLLILSLIWLRMEGYPLTWQALVERFRLRRMEGRDWLWSIGIVLLCSVAGFAAVSQVCNALIGAGWIPVPDDLPAFVSPKTLTDPMVAYDEAAGGLRGNWLLVLVATVTWVVNILGEEFWWRGVVLPRQERAFGRWAWVVHGLMWAAFHSYKWWDVLNLVPISLGLSYVCSRRKSTTPGIVIHSITNGVGLFPLIAAVLGLLG